MCASCSHVKPMPPSVCTQSLAFANAASNASRGRPPRCQKSPTPRYRQHWCTRFIILLADAVGLERVRCPTRTEICASSSEATDDGEIGSPSRNRAPSPLPPQRAGAGRGGDSEHQLAGVLEPDHVAQIGSAAHVALRAVDGIDDPPELGVLVDGARVRAELLAEHRVPVAPRGVADRALDGLVGLAHRREVGLRRDLQSVAPEAGHRGSRLPASATPARGSRCAARSIDRGSLRPAAGRLAKRGAGAPGTVWSAACRPTGRRATLCAEWSPNGSHARGEDPRVRARTLRHRLPDAQRARRPRLADADHLAHAALAHWRFARAATGRPGDRVGTRPPPRPTVGTRRTRSSTSSTTTCRSSWTPRNPRIDRHDLGIHLVVHPVLEVQRAADGCARRRARHALDS